jgi:primosomal protein N' (replication factor Y) (superfamily II helicase)
MTGAGDAQDQLTLVRSRVRKTAAPPRPAAELPIAKVAVDTSLAHLDRSFDYLVTVPQDQAAQPGVRVKVGFAGKELSGFLLERVARTDHQGRLAALRRVVSPAVVLLPAIAELARQVADRYAGTRADVLRLAVPPRHARVEGETPPPIPRPTSPQGGDRMITEAVAGWADYPAGEAFINRLSRGEAPRAVWSALPGAEWPLVMAHAAAAAAASGRGAILAVPDRRDIERADAAFSQVLGPDRHVVLSADLGPAARYRAFLAVARGRVQVVIGNRAAVFAPVHRLGLVAIWDDGDDSFVEPRAPYPHAREVLALRADQSAAAMLVGGHARTAEAQRLLDAGWAQPLNTSRAMVRARSPLIRISADVDTDLASDPAARSARLPRRAFEAIRSALDDGPVLMSIPRTGYLPALACNRCRQPATCSRCAGPLAIDEEPPGLRCRWCNLTYGAFRCRHCDGDALRAPVVGSRRTAEELGKAFPKVPLRTSEGDHVIDHISSDPCLVLATPGAEPTTPAGYRAAVVLDTWVTLGRPDLRTSEEAVRRWLNVAARVRPASQGGRVLLVGHSSAPTLQAVVRWDPEGFAARELAERASAGLPPAARMITVEGGPDAVPAFLAVAKLPAEAEVLGPGPALRPRAGEELVRAVIRAPRASGLGLVAAVRAACSVRSARKLDPVRVHVDPHEIG